MDSYEICSHADVGDRAWLHAAIARLNRLTFGFYDGVIVPTQSFVEWYTARPGMDPQLCQAAIARGELVSSVLVTLARMRLGGEIVLCGIVDEVMTHPNHRRRGLARKLMVRALDAMARAGTEVSLLYTLETDPLSVPQRLYESLGYRVYERVDRLVGLPGRASDRAQATAIPPDEAARAASSTALGDLDGWLELDDDLWCWRRVNRPHDYPVSLHRAQGGALAALATGDLITDGRPTPFAVLSDVVLANSANAEADLAELVGASPSHVPVTVLVARHDSWMKQLLQQQSFRVAGTELAMLRPFTPEAERMTNQEPRGWYVAVESVIGV